MADGWTVYKPDQKNPIYNETPRVNQVRAEFRCVCVCVSEGHKWCFTGQLSFKAPEHGIMGLTMTSSSRDSQGQCNWTVKGRIYSSLSLVIKQGGDNC